MKKYLLRYNFKNNQITQIFSKSLGELGLTDSEAIKFFELENYNKNKIIISIRQVIQPVYEFIELDLATGESKKIADYFGDNKDGKNKELGIVKYNKLNITDDLLIESIEDK
jgi:hypothetical protein